MHRWIVLVFVAALLAGCGGPPTVTPTAAPAVYGTLIGYTEVTTGHHVETIDINDVPSGHYPFNAVATYKEGTRVQILSHDQNDALVIGPDGVQGYTIIDSIRELCGSDCPLQ